MALEDKDKGNFKEYPSDNENNGDSDPDEESELTFYENLVRGNEFYLDEQVGIELLRGTCMTSNLSGNFLVTGSRDGTLRCLNFDKWSKGGFGDYWKVKLEQSVNGISFNCDESILAVASGNMLHFYTDGGDHIVSTTKGDMYLLDAKKTKGHTATVTCVANDSKNSNLFASGSMDGTSRVFDIQSEKQTVSLSLNNMNIYTLSNKNLIRNRAPNGGLLSQGSKMNRVGINCICYSSCNFKDVLVAGNELGNLVVWDLKTTFQNILINAHENYVESVLTYDDNKLVSKSGNYVKFWDLKQSQTPLKELTLPDSSNLLNCNQNMVLSPDNLHLLISVPFSGSENGSFSETNSKNKRRTEKTSVWVCELETFDILTKFDVQSELGPLVWTYETNQLFSLCSDGKIYSRCTGDYVGANHYLKAKQAFEKKNKYASVNTFSARPEAYSIDHLPDGLVEIEDGVLKKTRVETQDKYKIPKQEGYDYFNHGRTPITYEDDDIVTKLRSQAEKDPNRELSGKEGIEKIPYKADKFMAIYKKTQPNLILDFNKPESKQEKLLLGVSKCPRCGIKICQCGYMDRNK